MMKPHHLSTALTSIMITNTEVTNMANMYHSTCRAGKKEQGKLGSLSITKVAVSTGSYQAS